MVELCEIVDDKLVVENCEVEVIEAVAVVAAVLVVVGEKLDVVWLGGTGITEVDVTTAVVDVVSVRTLLIISVLIIIAVWVSVVC